MTAPAVVLVSGGLDSATALAVARDRGFACHALSFDYGQRHRTELQAAERVSRVLGAAEHQVVAMDLTGIGGSALTDPSIAVPETPAEAIPVTYVPARNSVFLAVAAGWAEVLAAQAIFVGVNAVDYSGYPDCRPEFIAALQAAINLGTRAGVAGRPLTIHTPLIDLTKAEIIRTGVDLGVDYSLTVSCYSADEQGRACGVCDACRFRAQGFREAGVTDPTVYQVGAPAS